MHRILLLEGIHSKAQAFFENHGLVTESLSCSLSETELISQLKNFHALGVRSKTQITENVIQNSPHLLAIGTFCIGTDQTDLLAAKKHGVPVFNAPYSNTRSVAELVLGLMISLSRHLGDRNRELHQGLWQKTAQGANEVRGKSLGIIGYGHIGSQVSVLAEAMGLQVYYYDIAKTLPLGNSKSVSSLDKLFEMNCDFISLHVPDTPLTFQMIKNEQILKMKKGSCLINTSRGTVVKIEDLSESLQNHHLGGAAIDVFPEEPATPKASFVSPLMGLPNVILTPHIGGSTEEAQANIGEEVAQSLAAYLMEGSTLGAVNFPHLNAPRNSVTRLVNIHKNVPGVLKNINSFISEFDINIESQHLATDPEVGYLIMDLNQKLEDKTLQSLKNLVTSIRTRMI